MLIRSWCTADEVDLNQSFCDALMREGKPDAVIGKMDRFAALIGRHLMARGSRSDRT